MRYRAVTAAAVGCLSLLAARFAPADEAAGPTDDNDFVAKAAVGGSTEVNLAKMADQRATDPEVKKYAQQLIADHTKANQKLLTLAGQKKIPVPRTIDAKHQECLDTLARLQGAAFDKKFKEQMVTDHETTIALFKGESRDGRDADLKALATETLPTLEEHLKMARQLNGSK